MPPKPKLNVQSFPRPPLLEKISHHVLVKYQNHTIAETKDAYWALETHHPPSNTSPLFFMIVHHGQLVERFADWDASILPPPQLLYHPPLAILAFKLLRVER